MTPDPLLAALISERYGPSAWWTDHPPRRPDLTDARIQRLLKESLEHETPDHEERAAS